MGLGIGSIDMKNALVFQTKKTAYASGYSVKRTARGSQSSKTSKYKSKKLNYNYKAVSSAILKAKTPTAAGQAVIKAKQMLAKLMKNIKMTESVDEELQIAIFHAKQMVLVAHKKKKNLEMEEKAKRGEGVDGKLEFFGEEQERKAADEDFERVFLEKFSEGTSENLKEELRQMLENLSEMEKELWQESAEEIEFAEGLSDLGEDDLENLKRKHRNSEWRDIVRADMKYLKAMSDKWEREKGSGGGSGGVSLEISGHMQPVEATAAMTSAGSLEGSMVDVSL